MTDYEITEAMIRYGGGFVSALGALYRRADVHNQAILRTAFPHVWIEYRQLLERQAAPHCPICGSDTWTYRGDAQVCADCGR